MMNVTKAEHYKTKQLGAASSGIWVFLSCGLVGLLAVGLLFYIYRLKKRRIARSPSQNGFVAWNKCMDRHPVVMISHSLPDLSRSVSHEYLIPIPENKKVARQTTLPTVPYRHESFKRQLSHKLDSVAFSVCSLKRKKTLGSIKPELYRKDLVRQESVESSQGSDTESAGTLYYTLKYDAEIEGLLVKVVQALNLPIKDVTGSSDPYVKIYLLPERNKKYCTKVHRRNLSPVFNETFVFSVTWEELANRSLQFSVYDFDRFSRNDLIGQVIARRLQDYLQPGIELEYAMDILTSKQDVKDIGEIMLSLCYLPKAGRLSVTIIKMRNLRALDVTGSSDPYVKVTMLCQSKKIKKKKTSVKKATLNPIYNELMVFDVPNENVQDITLLVKALDYDRVGSNELLGVVVIGAQAMGSGKDHWIEMLESSRRPVAQWYSLQESVPVSLQAVTSKKQTNTPCMKSP